MVSKALEARFHVFVVFETSDARSYVFCMRFALFSKLQRPNPTYSVWFAIFQKYDPTCFSWFSKSNTYDSTDLTCNALRYLEPVCQDAPQTDDGHVNDCSSVWRHACLLIPNGQIAIASISAPKFACVLLRC